MTMVPWIQSQFGSGAQLGRAPPPHVSGSGTASTLLALSAGAEKLSAARTARKVRMNLASNAILIVGYPHVYSMVKLKEIAARVRAPGARRKYVAFVTAEQVLNDTFSN
jgi:hypothetical protein